MNIKDMVANGRKVQFVRFADAELWYVTEDGFEFPVPIADTGEAAFLAQDKAMLFMRYIRKHLALLSEAGTAQFVRYKEGELWYVIDDGFEFPVPATAVKGTVLARDKAPLFAPYISEHRKMLDDARATASAEPPKLKGAQ
ncbi:hypothetical protein [Paraburkholderia sp. UCT31]|uniref:hypothetical protein n=1 Tax=Paraburkholderia sp. UCT31 TaxID=2615209 RepID=UPI0016557F9C|nr:hypothetical protein [Paraburkholderia sp. UCT31]